MPLIEPEPPMTRPRGNGMRRWSSAACGSVMNRQLSERCAMAAPTSAGTWMKGWRSQPPASMRHTRIAGSSESRAASTQPAVPAPTTM
jgi:hypothetical protein